jgi:hypothetical protein
MAKPIFLRCLLVSILLSALGPLLTMTIAVPAGEPVLDISGISSEELEEATPEELGVILEEKAEYRKVSGLERFSYVASHPHIWWFYFKAAAAIFCLVLPATLLVSFWNERARRAGP